MVTDVTVFLKAQNNRHYRHNRHDYEAPESRMAFWGEEAQRIERAFAYMRKRFCYSLFRRALGAQLRRLTSRQRRERNPTFFLFSCNGEKYSSPLYNEITRQKIFLIFEKIFENRKKLL